MAVPDFQSFFKPLLDLAADRKEHSRRHLMLSLYSCANNCSSLSMNRLQTRVLIGSAIAVLWLLAFIASGMLSWLLVLIAAISTFYAVGLFIFGIPLRGIGYISR